MTFNYLLHLLVCFWVSFTCFLIEYSQANLSLSCLLNTLCSGNMVAPEGHETHRNNKHCDFKCTVSYSIFVRCQKSENCFHKFLFLATAFLQQNNLINSSVIIEKICLHSFQINHHTIPDQLFSHSFGSLLIQRMSHTCCKDVSMFATDKQVPPTPNTLRQVNI